MIVSLLLHAARFLAVGFLAAAIAACSNWPPFASGTPERRPTEPAVIPDLSAYRLGIGDRIRIDVYGEADLSLDATVDPTGRISFPLLGSIPVISKTAREVQDSLTASLSNGYLINPDVRVTVIGYRPFYVIGQIRRAGAYPFVTGLTVEKALALAGGLTAIASTRKIFVVREGAAPGERLNVGLSALVLPGDTLIVEESLF